MSKRQNSSNEVPPTKRSRKAAGFRFARPLPGSSQPSISSNASLFVTVKQVDELCGTKLTGESRVLSNTPEPIIDIEARNEGRLPYPDRVEPPSTKPKRKRFTKNADRLKEWLEFRDTFLDELLHHDGLGDFLGQTECSSCKKSAGVIKCKDCPSRRMLKCPECVVELHQALPLHHVERWNGQFFDDDSLQNLGHQYQLGHSGARCPCPHPGPKNFIVFDVSGPHPITIDYCQCSEQPLSNWTQLLREQWFPATLSCPQTVFTFDCLKTFHKLTLQGKTSLYDYYHTLLRRSDNANISNSIKRYSEIHRVFRMWRNLVALKRAGRGHDPGGIDETSKGELLVECLACPHPGKNLPDDWEKAGPLLFLYILYLAVDANFKLKGKERNLTDIELMPGLVAYVPDAEYKTHVANYVDQPEINSCESQHDALVRAATRSSPGYAVSGVVVVICSRHCMIRKNGAGDLPKGEKYCNVDFIIFAALMGITLLWIILTYDIACQWSKNFRKRMSEFSAEMQIPDTTQVDVAIPGWHINGHRASCRENFNLSYIEGAGRTVGEDIKTTWAGTNPLAPSVREMGPVARHDTLNDHWNGWNFHKIVGFRPLFLKRFKEAFKMSAKQTKVFHQLSATFTPETVKKWETMVATWISNPKAPNPYQEPKSGTTLQDVQLELAKEDAAQVALGNLPRHKITLTAFLMIGFELEDSQYLLRREVALMTGSRSSKQLAKLQEKRTGLLRQIYNWCEVQLIYTPHVAPLLSQAQNTPENTTHATLAENVPLFLPSSLPTHIRTLAELEEICQLERCLREPQVSDALSEVRRQRHVIQGLWQFKCLNAAGTGNKPNTRMVTLYKRFDNKTKRAAQKYRVAWRALSVLDPNGLWSNRLKELKEEDIRGPGKDFDDPSTSRYVPSWIWLVPHVSESSNVETNLGEEEFNDSMRVEWAKAKAHMKRWDKELLIVQEEMRRVIVYHEWKAAWWRDRSSLQNDDDSAILNGVSGYAYKQAAICTRMAEQCAVHWLPHLKQRGITPSWGSDYEHLLQKSQVPGVVVQGEGELGETAIDVEGDRDADYEASEDEADSDIDDVDDDDSLDD